MVRRIALSSRCHSRELHAAAARDITIEMVLSTLNMYLVLCGSHTVWFRFHFFAIFSFLLNMIVSIFIPTSEFDGAQKLAYTQLL